MQMRRSRCREAIVWYHRADIDHGAYQIVVVRLLCEATILVLQSAPIKSQVVQSV